MDKALVAVWKSSPLVTPSASLGHYSSGWLGESLGDMWTGLAEDRWKGARQIGDRLCPRPAPLLNSTQPLLSDRVSHCVTSTSFQFIDEPVELILYFTSYLCDRLIQALQYDNNNTWHMKIILHICKCYAVHGNVVIYKAKVLSNQGYSVWVKPAGQYHVPQADSFKLKCMNNKVDMKYEQLTTWIWDER